jgi:hypothetical protein
MGSGLEKGRDWRTAMVHPCPYLHWAPHLHRDWAHPCHICTGTGRTPPHIGTRTAHPCMSAPGLGSPAIAVKKCMPQSVHLHTKRMLCAYFCC